MDRRHSIGKLPSVIHALQSVGKTTHISMCGGLFVGIRRMESLLEKPYDSHKRRYKTTGMARAGGRRSTETSQSSRKRTVFRRSPATAGALRRESIARVAAPRFL